MKNTVQIANLDSSVREHDLEQLFAPFGTVRSAKLAAHPLTGRTEVGFVEMASEQEGEAAVAALNGLKHLGRALLVCFCEDPPTVRPHPHGMFGPMNTPGDDDLPGRSVERRGLPAVQDDTF